MYSSLTACYRCMEGYYLTENDECVEVKRVPHCLKYNREKGKSNCIEC